MPSNTRHWIHPDLLLLLLVCNLSLPAALAAESIEKDKAAELETIRDRIKSVQSGIEQAQDKSESLQDELRDNEIASGKQALKLKELDAAIVKKQQRTETINHVITEHEKTLESERKQLTLQIRSAYRAGRSDTIKLLLNQEDPAKVGRVLAYHDYYNRARTKTIKKISEKVALVNELSNTLQNELGLLETLKQKQLERNRELAEYRQSRQSILAELQAYIASRDNELKTLRDNEKQLSELIAKLDKRDDRAVFDEDLPPFDSLKGSLTWPLEGKLLNRFGGQRKGAALEWKGVKIAADIGGEVQAIQTGKVIFADWFRNLGLLIILDHGDEYMSLYGYNQTLLKKLGDWVLAGEPIALSGDSGGQRIAGVYFEIRHHGKPLDPALWCKR